MISSLRPEWTRVRPNVARSRRAVERRLHRVVRRYPFASDTDECRKTVEHSKLCDVPSFDRVNVCELVSPGISVLAVCDQPQLVIVDFICGRHSPLRPALG